MLLSSGVKLGKIGEPNGFWTEAFESVINKIQGGTNVSFGFGDSEEIEVKPLKMLCRRERSYDSLFQKAWEGLIEIWFCEETKEALKRENKGRESNLSL